MKDHRNMFSMWRISQKANRKCKISLLIVIGWIKFISDRFWPITNQIMREPPSYEQVRMLCLDIMILWIILQGLIWNRSKGWRGIYIIINKILYVNKSYLIIKKGNLYAVIWCMFLWQPIVNHSKRRLSLTCSTFPIPLTVTVPHVVPVWNIKA